MACDDVANVSHRKGDLEKAVRFSERALAIDEAAPRSNPMRVGRDLNRLALLCQQQNPEEAERYIQRLLGLAGDLPQQSNLVRILFLREAADFYRRQGRNVEAETLLKQALQIDENAPRQDEMRAELASLYADAGKPEEAEKILRDAIKTGQAPNGKSASHDHSRVPIDLMRLARQYKDEGKLQESEESYNRAIALLEPDPKAITLLTRAVDELGEVYHAENRDSEAESLFLRAVSLWEQSVVSLHPDIVRRLGYPSGLQSLCYDQGRLSEMEPIFERELATLERVLGPEDIGVTGGLMELVHLYQQERKYAQAVPLYRRAIEITEKTRGADDPALISFLTNYAILLDEVGQKAEAARVRARVDRARAPKPSQNQKN